MNLDFRVDYEFQKPECFLSKNFYEGLTLSGELLKYKLSLHPYYIIVPSNEDFLIHIKKAAKNSLINGYSEELSGLEQLLFSINQTDFPSVLVDNMFDQNIAEIYNKMRKINHLTENQIYFSVKSGCISYNELEVEKQYFEKWIARVWAPKYKLPQIESFSRILSNTPVFNSEFFVFNKFTDEVRPLEIIEVFENIHSFTKNIKIFNNFSKEFIDDISKNIVGLIFKQNYINNAAESIYDKYMQDELNFSRDVKLNIH